MRELLKRAVCSAVMLTFICQVHAVQTTYIDEATFLGTVGPATTYDFEVSSGFPLAQDGPPPTVTGDIGLFDGIDMAATVHDGSSAFGAQGFTGELPGYTFGTAVFDFTGLSQQPTGIGFFGLDLTIGDNEKIDIVIDWESAGTQIYSLMLDPGDANFIPKYFGINDPTDQIATLSISGSDDVGVRTWYGDNLSVVGAVIPEPATLSLFTLAGLIMIRRRA